jgi:hypothetical protein
MHDTIFIGLVVLLGLALAYVGVYLAARRPADKHPKRIVVVLCFLFSAIVLLVAIYVASRSR